MPQPLVFGDNELTVEIESMEGLDGGRPEKDKVSIEKLECHVYVRKSPLPRSQPISSSAKGEAEKSVNSQENSPAKCGRCMCVVGVYTAGSVAVIPDRKSYPVNQPKTDCLKACCLQN